MVQSLRDILQQKTLVSNAESPAGMKSADWCWKVEGGFMAVWADMRAAVNWNGETIMGRVRYSYRETSWIVSFTDRVSTQADIYPSYDLDGMEA